jgi:hypothetical protein
MLPGGPILFARLRTVFPFSIPSRPLVSRDFALMNNAIQLALDGAWF